MRTVNIRNAIIQGREVSRFPLLVLQDGGVDIDVLRYLLSLCRRGAAPRSLETYASHLRDFKAQLEVDGQQCSNINDAYLTAYFEAIRLRASKPFAAQVLRTVILFLTYLEEESEIVGVVGEGISYPVAIVYTRRGHVAHALMRGGQSPKSMQVPSSAAIQTVKRCGPKSAALSDRLAIMIDWARVIGLRAAEVCAIKIGQLPDRNSVQVALMEDRTLEVRLYTTKGSKPRLVAVHPLLLDTTWNWIDTGRAEIVKLIRQRARSRGESPPKCDSVFLSASTGIGLTPKALSNSIRRAYKKAVAEGLISNAERVWFHGLRKHMINHQLHGGDTRDPARRERILMQQTGHSSLEALGRYVVIER